MEAMSCIIRSADHVLALCVRLKQPRSASVTRPANVDEATPSDSIQITSNNIVYATCINRPCPVYWGYSAAAPAFTAGQYCWAMYKCLLRHIDVLLLFWII